MSANAGRPHVVEVVGVAGAGKSTLARSLTGAGGVGPLADTLRTSEPRHLGAVVRGVPAALAALVRSLRDGRPLSWVELKLVLYLAGFDPAAGVVTGSRWIVVDQGPVYSLARLLARGGPNSVVAVGTRRWTRWIARWGARLDLVVLLDASTETLLARIDGRDQAHEVKHAEREEAMAFVDRFRAAYEQVVGALEQRGVPVARVDTGRAVPDEVLRRVLDAAAATVTGAVGQ